jgi:predicted  nucleic acid-binding Zn-ribbon protein
MSQTKALYRLQQLDLGIDTHRSRAREITAALEDDGTLREAQSAVEALQHDLRSEETRVADLNLEIQSVTTQTAQLTDRLYGGSVNNPKELEDIQDKIAERKRRRAVLEDQLLDAMIAVEDLQASLAGGAARLREVQTAWDGTHQALKQELQRVKQELKTLKTERDTAAGAVNADNLELYQSLRAQKRGQAVTALDGEMCSWCRVGQTANIVLRVRRGQDVILCASCGRILVAI